MLEVKYINFTWLISMLIMLLRCKGMLSKAKGQVLRVAALMHLLFEGRGDEITTCIDEGSIKAAIDFVEVCCQHTAFIAGRGSIDDEIRQLTSGMYMYIQLYVCYISGVCDICLCNK